MAIETKIVYFEKPGVINTDDVFRIVKQRAGELNIKTVLVASTTGVTAVKAVNTFTGMKIVIVTHCTGSREPNTQEFTEENAKIVRGKGGIILTTTHAFGGLSRSLHQANISQAPSTYVIGDIVANTLRMFGQGMKVVCEITAMAADAGLVRTDENVIAIAGNGFMGRGADTAVVLRPANLHNLFDMRIQEILCKPF